MRVALVVVLLVAGASAAHAQSAKAAAESAFHKAKDLMAAGDTAGACAAFEQSEQLDPQLGTQYNLALCDEKLGKLTSAWINYSEVAAKDVRGGRRDDSARRAKALEPRLTRMVISLAAPVPGESVKIGAIDVSVLAGTASPIDEGSYEVVASAPGFVRWHGQVDLSGEGKTVTIAVPALVKADVGAPLPPDAAVDPSRGHGRRVVGVVMGSAGLIAIGVGLYLGKQVFDLQGEAQDQCKGQLAPCNGDVQQAQALITDARGKATLADVAIGVGAAALLGGVILYATAPHGEAAAVTPIVGPDQVGLSFAGRF